MHEPTTDEDDPEATVDLLRRLDEEGDRDAIARILDGHGARLRRSVHFRMDAAIRARVDAADVVQDAMIEAVGRIEAYLDGPRQPLFLWLRFLALQRLLQLRRFHVEAQRRDVRREVRMAATSRADLAEQLSASITTPSGILDREEKRAALERALEALADADREILVLRCLEGLSNVEAARILGLGETTASSRFVRALARAQALLAER